MAVAGICGLLLDNLIPGTPEERGLVAWRQHLSSDETGEECQTASIHVYDLPFGLNRLSSFKVAKYLPFIPYYPEKSDGIMTEVNNSTPDPTPKIEQGTPENVDPWMPARERNIHQNVFWIEDIMFVWRKKSRDNSSNNSSRKS